MAATNENALQITAGEVYIASYSSITALEDDLSNATSVQTDLDALSYTRMASVIDTQIAVNTGENLLKVESDDNGTIYTAYQPWVTISGSRYEVGEMDVLEKIIGVAPVVDGDSKLLGLNIKSKTLPKLVVKIVGKTDASGNNNVHYLHDCGFEGDLVFGFVDLVRAGDLPNSPFEFVWNRWGTWLVDADRY